MTRSEHRDTLPFDSEIERTLRRLGKQAAEHSAQHSAVELHQPSAVETHPHSAAEHLAKGTITIADLNHG